MPAQKVVSNRPLGGMYPILIEGTKIKYVPWGNRDLDGLVGKLPHLRDGASRWISVLESETMGQMLAVGDIKVLLTKSLTREEMEKALTAGGMAMAVGSQLHDGRNSTSTVIPCGGF
ncbi:hypothetical protein DPEC_G00282870 [Dallia pectoralis]|uniref:Uncharacterized protein n=1 Tax=Dallia pectoralis TaxID=75939 RepID=A0ACC2FJ35_DALPE|nr:hypothetical protein DPEC_G00282870 [Dallia pectoralis]